jgi:hypothetical protein
MNVSPDKSLALVEAARLIFRTRTPTEQQVARVQKLMQSGMLADSHCMGPPSHWTTTPAAIADYLANESLKRQEAKYLDITGKPLTAPSLFDGTVPEGADTQQLKSLYKGIWSDYFLTVFMQRKGVHQSVNFRRAVLAGQISILLALVLIMIGGIGLTTESIPPQRSAVERWIAENTDQYSIQTWYPPEPSANGEGVVIRVKYSYQSGSPKPVYTDRRFLIIDDEASLLPEPD